MKLKSLFWIIAFIIIACAVAWSASATLNDNLTNAYTPEKDTTIPVSKLSINNLVEATKI